MRALSSWWTTYPARRKLLPEALATVLVVRLVLSVVPIAAWRGLSDRLRRRAAGATRHVRTPSDIAWAVRRVSRAVPGATCLTQSLAAQIVLARHGHESRLHVGVARAQTGEFRAHAWLESGERIVVGGKARDGYTLLQ